MWVGSSHLCPKFSERVGKFSCFQIFYTSVTLLDIYLWVFFFVFQFCHGLFSPSSNTCWTRSDQGGKQKTKCPRPGKTVQKGTNMAGAGSRLSQGDPERVRTQVRHWTYGGLPSLEGIVRNKDFGYKGTRSGSQARD